MLDRPPKRTGNRNFGHPSARALLRAVEVGDAAEVRRLIEAGAPAEAPLPGGETMLTRAAALGYEDVARELLKGGARIDARRDDGFTPLLVAAFRARTDLVRLLIEHGADTKAQTRSGSSGEKWANDHGFSRIAGLFENAAALRQELGQEQGQEEQGQAQEEFTRVTLAEDESVIAKSPDHEKSLKRDVEFSPFITSSEPFSSEPRRLRFAFLFVLLVAVSVGAADYQLDLRGIFWGNAQQPTPRPAGFSNVTPLAAPHGELAEPNVDLPSAVPTPAGTPQGIPGSGALRTRSTSSRNSSGAGNQSSAPEVVSEPDAPVIDEVVPAPRDAVARPSNASRSATSPSSQGSDPGAEIRGGPPSRSASQPSTPASSDPSPAPSPKKKVIQWP
jgi:hypothetical protein